MITIESDENLDYEEMKILMLYWKNEFMLVNREVLKLKKEVRTYKNLYDNERYINVELFDRLNNVKNVQLKLDI